MLRNGDSDNVNRNPFFYKLNVNSTNNNTDSGGLIEPFLETLRIKQKSVLINSIILYNLNCILM